MKRKACYLLTYIAESTNLYVNSTYITYKDAALLELENTRTVRTTSVMITTTVWQRSVPRSTPNFAIP